MAKGASKGNMCPAPVAGAYLRPGLPLAGRDAVTLRHTSGALTRWYARVSAASSSVCLSSVSGISSFPVTCEAGSPV